MPATLFAAPLALDGAAVGPTVTVRRILFEGLRLECARAGIREGTPLRLAMETGSHLLVELPGAVTAVIRRDWARFIEVQTAEDEDVSARRRG